VSEKTHVLIVEDSRTQGVSLQHHLQKAGYSVAWALSGREALDALDGEPRPALVISDIVMPGMDGYQLCRAIKGDARCAGIPVLLLTSLSDPMDVIRGLEVGADNFLTKPYRSEVLLARIERILRSAALRADGAGGDGVTVWFGGEKHVLHADTGQTVDFMVTTYEDAVERNEELARANRSLNEALEAITVLERRYRTLIESSADAMLVVDRDGVILYANRAAGQLFRRDPGAMASAAFGYPLVTETMREVELQLGEDRLVIAELRVVETQWSGEPAYLATLKDVTENVTLRERLRDLAVTDELTGLLNRRGFYALVESVLEAAGSDERPSLLYGDLDGFKRINDEFGHAAGDEALVEVAAVLRSALRDNDLIGRIGGDEFAALLPGAPASVVESVRDRIRAGLAALNAREGRRYQLDMSFGVVVSAQGDRLDDLTTRADALMYEDKARRKAARPPQ